MGQRAWRMAGRTEGKKVSLLQDPGQFDAFNSKKAEFGVLRI